MNEKRSMERMTLPFKTEVIDARTGQTITRNAKIRNLSRSGFGILTEEPLQPRVPYLFTFQINMFQSITVEGRVIHTKADSLFHLNGATIKPVTLGDRVQFNRFLMERIASTRRQFRFYAVGVGEILFLVAAMFMGLSLPMSAMVAIGATLALMVWVPF